MKYHIITYGCQMNKSDSERIASVLEKIGCQATNKISKADLIVINMCSVRQSAVDRVYGLINKPKSKTQKIILTGCILPPDKRKMKNKVDLIFNIKDLPKLPLMLKPAKLTNLETRSPNYLETWSPNYRSSNYLSLSSSPASTFSAYVPVMTGCNNFCTYCVVPRTRGREFSRPVEEIINEIKDLIGKGYKEIILLGQNVNSYKGKIKNKKLKNLKTEKYIDFADLLKLIDNFQGKFWLTFITSHPKDLSDKLIKVMASGKKIMPYLHLPIQSGDNEILKKMNRGYTVEDYKNLIHKIRHHIPFVNISTDIIVGFPGETKKQFKNTAKLMKWVKFDMAYIARYSPRFGTIAANFEDNINYEEKKEREKLLTEILKKTALKNNEKYLGKTVEVLIGKNEKNFSWGKTKNLKNIKINYAYSYGPLTSSKNNSVHSCHKLPNPQLKNKKNYFFNPGKFVKVKIIKSTPWRLEGFTRI